MGRPSTPAALYDEERLSSDVLADFRCERCQGRYPNTPEFLVVQDGAKLCRVNCAYRESPSEREILRQEGTIETAQLTADAITGAAQLYAKAGNWSLMDGVSAITSVVSGTTTYPAPIAISPGGSVPITATGIAFTIADVISYSTGGLSNNTPTISPDQTSMTFTVTASGALALGDYDLLFNGTRFPKMFRVR